MWQGGASCDCWQAGEAARRAVRADAPGLARTVGAHAAALPELLADLPPGSEQLALQMLYVLTGALTRPRHLTLLLSIRSCAPQHHPLLFAGLLMQQCPAYLGVHLACPLCCCQEAYFGSLSGGLLWLFIAALLGARHALLERSLSSIVSLAPAKPFCHGAARSALWPRHRMLSSRLGCAERPPATPEGVPPPAQWPPAALVRACLAAADARADARFLPPALPGLAPKQALALLPRLLGLAPAGFRAALHRMLMPLPSGAALRSARPRARWPCSVLGC